MAGLPFSPPGTRTVKLSGGEVTVRGLTVGQVRTCRKLQGDASDHLAITMATGTPREEVAAWFDQAPAGDFARLIEAIWDASGLGEGAQFQGAAPDDAGDARPAE